MNHEYFTDAVDPLIRPKSSSRLLGRKQSANDTKSKEPTETAPQRTSWFRKSLIGRDSAPAVPQYSSNPQLMSPGPSPVQQQQPPEPKPRPQASKRATWASGPTPNLAPMPILPSIRPISPLSNAVTARGRNSPPAEPQPEPAAAIAPKKIGRQLSLASHGNHYGDLNAERALHGLSSPTSQKEGFFSHLRKRARRLSGRHQAIVTSPREENVLMGQGPSASNRSSMLVDPLEAPKKNSFMELDNAMHNVRYGESPISSPPPHVDVQTAPPAVVKRSSSLRHGADENQAAAPVSNRTRRTMYLSSHPAHRYETPDEEEELLDEALNGAHRAARGLDHDQSLATKDLNRSQPLHHSMSVGSMINPYPTPSPSAKRSGVIFGNGPMEKPAPMEVRHGVHLPYKPTTPVAMPVKSHQNDGTTVMWPTPPYEENEWAAAASASIFAAGSMWR
jgi:meiosis induction protein kinase IME2/SME1